VGHEATDEVNVAAEAVELRHGHVAPKLPRGGQGGLELRTAIQGVRAFPSFYLDELSGDGEAFGLSEVGECAPLGLNA
jgi:hypothetical protein